MGVLIWSNSADLKHQPWPTLHVQQPLLCQQLPPVADCIFQDGHNRISQPTYAVMLTLLPMRGGGLCSFPLNLGGHVTDRGDATGLLRLDHKTCCNFCQAHGNYFHTESSELPCKQPNHQPPKSLHAVRKPRPMERPHTVIHLTNPAKVPANSCGNKQTSKERSRLWKWTFSLSHLHFPSWSPSYDKAKQSVTSMPLLNCQPEGFRGIKMFDILSYLGMDPCTASGTVAAVVV